MNSPEPAAPAGAPSLTTLAAAGPGPANHGPLPPCLQDLLADGFYLLLLLKRGQRPADAETGVAAVQSYLDAVEHRALKLGIAAADIEAARYALCAAIDEAVLAKPSPIHEAWERRPLQLRLFGEHLAGEHFFDRLEALRREGVARLPALEVCHYCLLLGFEGKYRLEGREKLGWLTARLGDEISFLKSRRSGFAPRALPPDQIRHRLRRIVPLWLPAALVAGFGLLGFLGLRSWLDHRTEQQLAAYQQIIKLPQRTAHIAITLP